MQLPVALTRQRLDFSRSAAWKLDGCVRRPLLCALVLACSAIACSPDVETTFLQRAEAERYAGASGSREWYVSPTGAADADGSIDRPVDLPTALSDRSPARPGDTIWLRGGVYRGGFTSVLSGTANSPILVRQYPGERAILDGQGVPSHTLAVRGAHTWYWGFEVTNTDPRRVYDTRINFDEPATFRGTGISVYGPHIKCINVIVHDALDGIGLWESAIDAEVSGALTFNNGIVDTARGHGHGLYIQNRTGTKRMIDVISFGNHATGMKAYGEAGAVEGVEFSGVTSFNNGVFLDAPQSRMDNLFVGTVDLAADRITVTDNVVYHASRVLGPNVRMGYVNRENGSLRLQNNLILGGSVALGIGHWRDLTVTANTIYAEDSDNRQSDQSLVQLPEPPEGTAYRWDGNNYFDGTAARYAFAFGQNLNFDDWRAKTRLDATSNYQVSRPTRTIVRLRPNAYERGRGHLVVYNGARRQDVRVDLSTLGLNRGQMFEIRDAMDYFGAPILTARYLGVTTSVPLPPAPTVGAPVGETKHRLDHTAPELYVFVVVPR